MNIGRHQLTDDILTDSDYSALQAECETLAKRLESLRSQLYQETKRRQRIQRIKGMPICAVQGHDWQVYTVSMDGCGVRRRQCRRCREYEQEIYYADHTSWEVFK